MDGKLTPSRRDIIGIGSLVIGTAAIGAPAVAASPAVRVHSTDPELQRVARLYAGEFGGGRGGR